MQEQKEEVIDLRGILRLFRKRLGLIFFTTFVVIVLGSIYTLFIATPIYTASTQLVVRLPDSTTADTNYAGTVTGNIQLTNTINQVVVSSAILDKVQKNLNLTQNFQKDVSATSATNSQVINITVKYTDPYTAKRIANETAQVFSSEASKILNVTNVSILAEAKVNKTPVTPRPKLYFLISVVAGLILGIALALLLETLDNKIRVEEDIEIQGFSVLGSISYIAGSEFTGKHLNNKASEKLNGKDLYTRRGDRQKIYEKK